MRGRAVVHALFVAIYFFILPHAAAAGPDSESSAHNETTLTRKLLARDFGFYYVAFKVFNCGRNPYNEEFQTAAGVSAGIPAENVLHLGAYNPWFFLLAPLFSGVDAVSGYFLWFGINLALLLFTGFLTARLLSISASPVRIAIACLAYFPAVICLQFGQIGIMLAFAIVASLYLFQQKRDILVGPLTLILSLKLNVIYLFIPAIFSWSIRNRRYSWFASAVLSHIVALIAVELLCPGIFHSWFVKFQTLFAQIGDPFTPTLPRLIQLLYVQQGMEAPRWPLIAVPVVSLIAVVCWLLVKKPRQSLTELSIPLLTASLITTTYTWPTDYLVIFHGYFAVFFVASSPRTKWAPRVLYAMQLVCVVLYLLPNFNLVWLWWFPPMIYLLWKLSR